MDGLSLVIALVTAHKVSLRSAAPGKRRVAVFFTRGIVVQSSLGTWRRVARERGLNLSRERGCARGCDDLAQARAWRRYTLAWVWPRPPRPCLCPFRLGLQDRTRPEELAGWRRRYECFHHFMNLPTINVTNPSTTSRAPNAPVPSSPNISIMMLRAATTHQRRSQV